MIRRVITKNEFTGFVEDLAAENETIGTELDCTATCLSVKNFFLPTDS